MCINSRAFPVVNENEFIDNFLSPRMLLLLFLYSRVPHGNIDLFENAPHIHRAKSTTSLFPWKPERDFADDVTICSSVLARGGVGAEVGALAIACAVHLWRMTS